MSMLHKSSDMLLNRQAPFGFAAIVTTGLFFKTKPIPLKCIVYSEGLSFIFKLLSSVQALNV